MSFCNEHPNVKVGQILFEKLKPYFLRSNKVFETCCCHHIEFDLHYHVFQKFVEDTHGFHVAPPSRRSKYISSILCDKIDDPTGQINYIEGLCETCGELALFPLKIENIDVAKKLN